jgi:4'-phosphopantetheinyl transferase EntD
LFAGLPVVAYECLGDPDRNLLEAGELHHIERVGVRRARDFTAGRVCAHACLRDLGVSSGPLLRGRDGPPMWPPGVTGTITHTAGYAMAAVARIHDMGLLSVGVDVELVDAVTSDVHEAILTPDERRRMARVEAERRQQLATWIFCAKEAWYKAQFMVTRSWMDFHDVEVVVSEAEVRLNPATPLEVLSLFQWPVPVRVVQRGQMVVAAVALLADHLR